MERGERGGRRKKWRKWDGEKEKGGGFKGVKGEGERRPLLFPPPPTPPKKCGHSDISCSTKRCLGASV